jgi:hypothetical protein
MCQFCVLLANSSTVAALLFLFFSCRSCPQLTLNPPDVIDIMLSTAQLSALKMDNVVGRLDPLETP